MAGARAYSCSAQRALCVERIGEAREAHVRAIPLEHVVDGRPARRLIRKGTAAELPFEVELDNDAHAAINAGGCTGQCFLLGAYPSQIREDGLHPMPDP